MFEWSQICFEDVILVLGHCYKQEPFFPRQIHFLEKW